MNSLDFDVRHHMQAHVRCEDTYFFGIVYHAN